MPRQARNEVIDPNNVQVLHCVQRCVRRAFLCGDDPLSGKNFEHRREWIRLRLEFLASVFAIDCLTYTILHNHLHIVLRSRPDVLETWSDDEVARRSLRLFPKRRNKDGSPKEPTQGELNSILNDSEKLVEARRRLSDVSWWMKSAAENIARRSNREDEVTGHFWEGRFKAQLLLDEASLLACAAYVDLNPIRAALAETPETSDFTGAKDRLDDLSRRSSSCRDTHDWERSRRRKRSGWMSPIEISESQDPVGADADPGGRRASRKGFLPMSMTAYLEFLDWTGRQIRADKLGAIPDHLAPILDRLGLDASGWCGLVRRFGKIFKRAAGTAQSLRQEAARRNVGWMQAPGNPLHAA